MYCSQKEVRTPIRLWIDEKFEFYVVYQRIKGIKDKFLNCLPSAEGDGDDD